MLYSVTNFTARRTFPKGEHFKAKGYIIKDVEAAEECIVLKDKSYIFFPWRKICGVLAFQNYFS